MSDSVNYADSGVIVDIAQEGQWLIATQSSVYEVDFEQQTIRRTPGVGASEEDQGAASLRRDREEVPLLGLLWCRVGLPLRMLVDLRGDGIATIRQSTPVEWTAQLAGPRRGKA